ncbi:hypothetical protein KKB64_00480 [Patescibacteria group bacterium]|nr:hypothetical protein [Patescibacteria group bacterium]
MASLTETAYYTRRTINWIIFAMIAYIVLRMLWGVASSLWLAVFPPKPPPPTHSFGRLPALVFPSPQASPSGRLTYRLETIEGTVPPASESATVYFMPKSAANLLALTKTQDFAQRLGFSPTPIQETKTIYRFNDAQLPLRKLRYDIVSSNFIQRYSFEDDTALFNEKNLPLPKTAESEAKSMLQTYDLYPPDLAGGTVKTIFLKLSGNSLTPTSSLSQADAMRLDFFRKPIGDMPLLTPDPDQASVSFVFSGSNVSGKRILQFAYTYWPIDYQTSSTYALKPSAEAWQELVDGGGYIARYPNNGTDITVRTVYLAYYDSFEPQTYLQPIFVFDGDNGYLAYVQGVAREWME